jgi:Zn-dependent protease with chaperone function
MSNLLGNVFQPGQKGCLCLLQVQGSAILATPKKAEEGNAPIRFELEDRYLSFGGDGGTQIVLKNSAGATLYAERALLEPALQGQGDRAFQDRLKKEDKRVTKSRRLSLAGFFGFFAACGLLMWIGVVMLNWGIDRMVDRIPVAWEQSLGELVMQSGVGPEIVDPKVVQPVQAVLQRLAEADSDQPYKLTLHVIESDQLNAFAAPGGQIVVYTGLLEKTHGPDELAGVLAHELQHVYNRHGLRNMVHSVKWQILAAILLGDVGSVQQVLLGKAPEFLSLSYGRTLEEEADIEGVELLCRAHMNPQGMVSFFEVMKDNELDFKIPEFMSSHPETEKRIAHLKEWVAEHPECKIEPLTLDWVAMQEALKAGSSPSSQE